MFAPGGTFAEFFFAKNLQQQSLWNFGQKNFGYYSSISFQANKLGAKAAKREECVFLFSLCFSCQDNMATCDGLLLFGVELSWNTTQSNNEDLW